MGLYRRALRTFDTASLTGSFQNVGAVIPFPTSNVAIYNTSTVGVLITDGSGENNLEIPGGGTLSIGPSTDSTGGGTQNFVFAASTQLQVMQVTAAAAGRLIINCLG